MRLASFVVVLTFSAVLTGCAPTSEFLRGFSETGLKRAVAEGVDIGTESLADKLGMAQGDVARLRESVSGLAMGGKEPAEERGGFAAIGAAVGTMLVGVLGGLVRRKFGMGAKKVDGA